MACSYKRGHKHKDTIKSGEFFELAVELLDSQEELYSMEFVRELSFSQRYSGMQGRVIW
jgi:hypothetical protein